MTLGMAINGNGPVRVSTYADTIVRRQEPGRRRRGGGARERTRGIPAVPRGGAGAERSSSRRCNSRCSAASRSRGAIASIIARVKPLLPA